MSVRQSPNTRRHRTSPFDYHWPDGGPLEVGAHVLMHRCSRAERVRAARMFTREAASSQKSYGWASGADVVHKTHVLLKIVDIDEKAVAVLALFGVTSQVRLFVVRNEPGSCAARKRALDAFVQAVPAGFNVEQGVSDLRGQRRGERGQLPVNGGQVFGAGIFLHDRCGLFLYGKH